MSRNYNKTTTTIAFSNIIKKFKDNRISKLVPSARTLLVPLLLNAYQEEALSSITSMPLPPKAVFNSRHEVYSSIQAWASQYFYEFRIERSKKINNGVRARIIYGCDRAGEVPPEKHPKISSQDNKRQTASCKTDIQLSIITVERADTQ